MNTPAHIVLNLVCIGRRDRQSTLLPVITGALLPDAPMVLFFIVETFIFKNSQEYIWRTAYFLPHWQHFIDLFNSLPIILVGLAVCIWKESTIGKLFFASMLLHVAGDLPLHHDDGHAHFFPFSSWTFSSPVSYWDKNHHGHIASILEILAVILGSIFLFRRYETAKAKLGIGIMGLLYLLFFIFAILVWGYP